MPARLRDLLDEAFPLMAEDLRSVRLGLRITSTTAAERAGLDLAVYRALEEGNVERAQENVGTMMAASQCLGLEAARFSYVDEVQQFMKVDLSTDGPQVIFLDSVRLDVRELKEQSVFISPHRVLALVEDLGFFETLASRKLVDKQLIELWVAAVFTLVLDDGLDYYVKLARSDPPDVELLRVNAAEGHMDGIMLEITQHGTHSQDLFDVIGKKLRKRYQEGTVLVVLVEKAEEIPVVDLDEFIRANNPHNQHIVIIGGTAEPGTYKVIPWDEVDRSTPDGVGWWEIKADEKNASKGHRGYDGVVLKPPGSWFLPPRPVFVKELDLRRQT